MLNVDPIYLVLGALAIAAAALWIQTKIHQWLLMRPARDAAPIRGSAPLAPLDQAWAAVEALTPGERQTLRSWMDRRWPTASAQDERAAIPGGEISDERITP